MEGEWGFGARAHKRISYQIGSRNVHFDVVLPSISTLCILCKTKEKRRSVIQSCLFPKLILAASLNPKTLKRYAGKLSAFSSFSECKHILKGNNKRNVKLSECTYIFARLRIAVYTDGVRAPRSQPSFDRRFINSATLCGSTQRTLNVDLGNGQRSFTGMIRVRERARFVTAFCIGRLLCT